MTAAGAYCQRNLPSSLSTRCSRVSSSSASRGVVNSDPSPSRASIASSAFANEASARVMATLRSFPVVVEVWGWDEAFVGAVTETPEALAREKYAYDLEERTAEVLSIPAASIKDVTAPDDAALVAYHKDHADKYQSPEYRAATLLHLSPADFTGAPYFAMLLVPGQGRLL